jgi:hypothetical protein
MTVQMTYTITLDFIINMSVSHEILFYKINCSNNLVFRKWQYCQVVNYDLEIEILCQCKGSLFKNTALAT